MNVRDINILRFCVYSWRNIENRFSYSKGRNNQIHNKGVKVNTRIQIRGKNNQVILEKGCGLRNSLIKVAGNNNIVVIHKGAFIYGAELWIEDNNCRIEIGDNAYIGHHSHLACTEDGSQLVVGSDGMMSSYVQVRTGDSHSILDLDGNRINPAESVKIGNHVWLGEGSKVLKGVTLGDHVVVSTGAIVTKSFGSNVLLGGIPAKVLKEKITWDSKRL